MCVEGRKEINQQYVDNDGIASDRHIAVGD